MTDSTTRIAPPALTLFEAIEQENDHAVSDILDQIITTAHAGGLEAEDIFDMLEGQDLQIGDPIKQIITNKLKAMEHAILSQQN